MVMSVVEVKAAEVAKAVEIVVGVGMDIYPTLHGYLTPVLILLRCKLNILRNVPNGRRTIGATVQPLHCLLLPNLHLKTRSLVPLRIAVVPFLTTRPSVGPQVAISEDVE